MSIASKEISQLIGLLNCFFIPENANIIVDKKILMSVILSATFG